MNLLFVCSKNQWRSPTAEKIWQGRDGMQARSGGTNRAARHQISHKDIAWADKIFVMEQKHKSRLLADFRRAMTHKVVHVLDIADDYQFMDDELMEILEESVAVYL